MRKLFLYSLRTFALLLVLIVTAYFVVLHTQKGAQWVISYLTQSTTVKIKTIEGTLSNELKLTGVTYNDDSALVQAKEIHYKIKNINWFSRMIALDSLTIKRLDIELFNSQTETKPTIPFEGMRLPFEIKIPVLRVQQISIKSEDKIENLKHINLSVYAKDQDVNVSQLSIAHQDFLLEGSASTQLMSHLPFDLSIKWRTFNEENNIEGSGNIKGDLSKISINQAVNITKGLVIGSFNLDATLDLKNELSGLSVNLASEQLVLKIPGQASYYLESLKTKALGSLNSYELTSDVVFFNDEIEKTTLTLKGLGNLESINLSELNINNTQGTIKLPTLFNWVDGVSATTQLQLVSLNPAAYIPDWPGVINGNSKLTSKLLANGEFLFLLEDAVFKGKIKQKEFKLQADVDIKPDDITVKNAQIIMGDNKLDINAIVNNQKIQADLKLELNDLSVFDKDAQGIVRSSFTINGDYDNPEIIGQANIKKASYQDYTIDSLDFKANGNLLSQFSTQTTALGVSIKDEFFNSIQLKLQGNKDKHELKVFVDEEIFSTELTAIGRLIDTQNYYWKGEVLEHKLYFKDINSAWELNEPLKIDYNKDINLSKACWINKDTSGDMCVDFAINTTSNNHKVNLDLNKLNVRFLQIFLPKGLKVDGYLDGTADILLFEDNVNINSKFNFLNGEIHFLKDSDQAYKAKILTASIEAVQEGQKSKLISILELDDGTKLSFDLDLSKSIDNKFEVKGDINGVFTNTKYLATLTNEIDEMNGDFNIKATFEGPLSEPVINFNANQEQGYLVLSRTKAKVENIHLQLHQQPNQDLELTLNATTGEGQLNGTGQLKLNISDPENLWQLTAQLKGDDIRLLTLPELKLDITPNIKIKANNKRAEITGEIKIPYARVNIKQLPESATSSSPDVVVHKDNAITEHSDIYPIDFDILAQLQDSVKIDILGLVSDVKGSLKVTNNNNSRIYGYGSLSLINGKYTIYGQTLDISKGELLFNGAIDNPSLDVMASRQSISGDVTAGVELGGTVNYLQSSLYSVPVLSDLEILSYILSGRGLNEDSDTNSDQLAQAAILLGLKKSSPIFSEIQSKLGIDVLTIKEGATVKDSIVEAGKQFNEKLYVGYNQGLFNRIGFWVLRYRINKALRLETTQGETQSVDLIYSRRKK